MAQGITQHNNYPVSPQYLGILVGDVADHDRGPRVRPAALCLLQVEGKLQGTAGQRAGAVTAGQRCSVLLCELCTTLYEQSSRSSPARYMLLLPTAEQHAGRALSAVEATHVVGVVRAAGSVAACDAGAGARVAALRLVLQLRRSSRGQGGGSGAGEKVQGRHQGRRSLCRGE